MCLIKTHETFPAIIEINFDHTFICKHQLQLDYHFTIATRLSLCNCNSIITLQLQLDNHYAKHNSIITSKHLFTSSSWFFWCCDEKLHGENNTKNHIRFRWLLESWFLSCALGWACALVEGAGAAVAAAFGGEGNDLDSELATSHYNT